MEEDFDETEVRVRVLDICLDVSFLFYFLCSAFDAIRSLLVFRMMPSVELGCFVRVFFFFVMLTHQKLFLTVRWLMMLLCVLTRTISGAWGP